MVLDYRVQTLNTVGKICLGSIVYGHHFCNGFHVRVNVHCCDFVHVQSLYAQFETQFLIQFAVFLDLTVVQPLYLFQFKTFFEHVLFQIVFGFRQHLHFRGQVAHFVTEFLDSLGNVVAACVLLGAFGSLGNLLFVYLDCAVGFDNRALYVFQFGLDTFNLACDGFVLFVTAGKAAAHVGEFVLQAVVCHYNAVDTCASVVQLRLRVAQILKTRLQRSQLCTQRLGVTLQFHKFRIAAYRFPLQIQQIFGTVVACGGFEVVVHRFVAVLLHYLIVCVVDVVAFAPECNHFGIVDVDMAFDFLDCAFQFVTALEKQLAVEGARFDFRFERHHFGVIEVGGYGKHARSVVGVHLLTVEVHFALEFLLLAKQQLVQLRFQLTARGFQLQQTVLVVLHRALQVAHFFVKRSVDCFQFVALAVQHFYYAVLGFKRRHGNVQFFHRAETLDKGKLSCFPLGNLSFLDGDFALQLVNLCRHFVDFDVYAHRFQQFADGLAGHAETVQPFLYLGKRFFDCVQFVGAHCLFAFKALLRFVKFEQHFAVGLVLFVQRGDVTQFVVYCFETRAFVGGLRCLQFALVKLLFDSSKFVFRPFKVGGHLVTLLFVLVAFRHNGVELANARHKRIDVVAQLYALAQLLDFVLMGEQQVVALLRCVQLTGNSAADKFHRLSRARLAEV